MKRTVSLAIGIVLAVLVHCELACAAQRTFVASAGNDANACSLASPCRSFAAAMTHTDDGGEVVVLDSAGYGTFTISQSVSIIASPGVHAGITASDGENGITVGGVGVKVALRGLHVNGLAGSLNGIAFTGGTALYVDDCVIRGFAGGIRVTGGGTVIVRGTAIADSGAAGIDVSSANVARVVLDGVSFENNLVGVIVRHDARTLARGVTIAGNTGDGFSTGTTAVTERAEAIVERSRLVHNFVGVFAGGVIGAQGTTAVIVSNSSISWNTTGWNVLNDASADLYTLGNNTVRFNTTNQAGKAEVMLAPN